jgi:phosphoglycerol geranylgeranyltransferase
MSGNKVESFLKSELKKKNALLFVLIDSEVSNLESSKKLAKDVEKIGASAILVGGSSATDQIERYQNTNYFISRKRYGSCSRC